MNTVANMNARLSEKLGSLAGRKHVHITGSGTAALMVACSLSPPERPRVLIPAISCPQVAYGVMYANREPVLTDVRESDATIDPQRVAAALAADPSIGAVVGVHLYGHAADLDALRAVTRSHGALLIEDAAQAQGGSYPDGSPFGSKGDVSVMSFGHTKIIDAGGGGALMLDDEVMARSADRRISRLPSPPENIAELRQQYSRLYYAMWEAYSMDPRFGMLFRPMPSLFRRLFVHAATEDRIARIVNVLPGLNEALRHRRMMFSVLEIALQDVPGVRVFRVNSDIAAPWRFSFRVPSSARHRLLEALRGARFHASAWYPSLSGWCVPVKGGRDRDFPVARAIGSEVVNLWIDESTAPEDARRAAQLVAARMASGT